MTGSHESKASAGASVGVPSQEKPCRRPFKKTALLEASCSDYIRVNQCECLRSRVFEAAGPNQARPRPILAICTLADDDAPPAPPAVAGSGAAASNCADSLSPRRPMAMRLTPISSSVYSESLGRRWWEERRPLRKKAAMPMRMALMPCPGFLSRLWFERSALRLASEMPAAKHREYRHLFILASILPYMQHTHPRDRVFLFSLR